MAQLTLYSAKGSCSLVPHAVLHHFNIPFRLVPMKFGPEGVHSVDGSISASEYRNIHPLGYVPALVVNDTIITEVAAVLDYISSLVPEAQLFGKDSLAHAHVVQWLSYLSGSVHGRGFGLLFRPSRFSDDEQDFDKLKAKGKEFLGSCFRLIDGRLEDKKVAVGDQVTVVDFYLYIFAIWGKQVGFDLGDQYPHYAAHATSVEKLDGVGKALKEQDLPFSFA